MSFSYRHIKQAKKSVSPEYRQEVGDHINEIYSLANKKRKQYNITQTLNPRYESHLVCLNTVGTEYLSTLEKNPAVEALLSCGDSFDRRKEMLASGDLSFTHDDSAMDTFNQLQKFCFMSNWDISNIIRYLHAANAIMNYADSNKKREINLVDIGCSSGTFIKFWYDNCQRAGKNKLNYLGIEVSEERFLEAKENWGHHDNLKFENLDIIKTPLPSLVEDDSVDVMLLMEVIEHVGQESARKILKDSHHALRPNGLVCISSPNPKKHLGQEFVWPDNHAYEFSIIEMRNELVAAGFEIVNETGWACDLMHFKKDFSPEQKKLFDALNGLGSSFAGSVLAYLMPEEAKHYTIVARKI